LWCSKAESLPSNLLGMGTASARAIRELSPAFVDAAMALAEGGLGQQVSKLLLDDEYGATMEPLIVALKLKRGDSPIVAKEVLEVAFDIAKVGAEPKTPARR